MKMKMKPEHFARLNALVEPLDTWWRRNKYLKKDFPYADKCKDFNQRYRSDLLWLTNDESRNQLFKELSEYLNDTHIDTALKKIVPPL
jgi:hypothetical protein